MSDQASAKSENTKSFARCRNQLLVLSFALLMIAQSIGCASFSRLGVGEAIAVGYRDLVWARRAFNLRYGNCERPYAEHFENGFCAGYTDTANGGDGFVPALPPAEYRGFEFQSVDGSRCVNTWFEGYPAGVAAAKQDKAGNYHDVMISRMVNAAIKQENTKANLPLDVPIIGAKELRNPPTPVARSRSRSFDAPPKPKLAPTGLPPIVTGNELSSSPVETVPKIVTPTGLPPIISSDALAISPAKTLPPIEQATTTVPGIVPASYGTDRSNTLAPLSVPNKPWNSSRK